jgi:hypothetical protein
MATNYLDYLTQIYKQANPTASDEEIKAKVNQTDPTAAQDALSPYMNNYDLNVSNNTVPMQGRLGSLPSQAGGIPTIPEVPSTGGATRSWEEAPTASVTAPVEPSKPQIEAPKQALGAPKTSQEGPNPLDTLLQASSTDQDARTKMLQDEESKRKWGAIPIALGGIGDAIGYGAAAYGGKGGSGTAERIAADLQKQETGRKADFEENLKNDPKSQISDHYRNVLAMMMNIKPTDPKIANLSASYIKETIPEIEKYMTKKMEMDQKAQDKKLATTSKPSTAQTAVDREFAKDYAKYIAGGGAADTMTQIGSLEEVQLQLEQGKQLTGPMVSAIPDAIRKRVMPDSVAAQQTVELSIQRTLKQTLGGQFTEREGMLFMQRGYDPALPEAENAKKLARTINQLKMMAVAKQRASDYYEENGTLAGFKGKLFTIKDGDVIETSKDDFYKMMEPQKKVTQKTTEGTPVNQTIPTVSSQQEYDALPSGSSYKDANGKPYKKK